MPKKSYLMPIRQWVTTVLLASHKFGPCYIAIMPDDSEGYRMEVEVSQGEIAGSYPTGTTNLRKARKMANEMAGVLQSLGHIVFHDRTAWAASVAETMLPLPGGGALCFSPAEFYDSSQVGIRDRDGNEIVIWTSDEWRDDPDVVMRAIFGSAVMPVDKLIKTLKKKKVKDGCWV